MKFFCTEEEQGNGTKAGEKWRVRLAWSRAEGKFVDA